MQLPLARRRTRLISSKQCVRTKCTTSSVSSKRSFVSRRSTFGFRRKDVDSRDACESLGGPGQLLDSFSEDVVHVLDKRDDDESRCESHQSLDSDFERNRDDSTLDTEFVRSLEEEVDLMELGGIGTRTESFKEREPLSNKNAYQDQFDIKKREEGLFGTLLLDLQEVRDFCQDDRELFAIEISERGLFGTMMLGLQEVLDSCRDFRVEISERAEDPCALNDCITDVLFPVDGHSESSCRNGGNSSSCKMNNPEVGANERGTDGITEVREILIDDCVPLAIDDDPLACATDEMDILGVDDVEVCLDDT